MTSSPSPAASARCDPLQLQRAGRAPMSAADFLRGFRLPPGMRLPQPDEAAP